MLITVGSDDPNCYNLISIFRQILKPLLTHKDMRMHLLTTLLLAHLFADFPLQTNGLAKLKRESLTGVFLHVLIYVTITACFLSYPFRYWGLVLGLGAAHFGIDALKIRYKQTFEPYYFVFDQCLHLLSIIVATYIALTYYHQPPQSIVSYEIMTLALGCALLLAFMVFCWVWVNSLNEERVRNHFLLYWAKHQMLELEQRIGLVLIGFVFAGPTYQWLTNVLQGMLK